MKIKKTLISFIDEFFDRLPFRITLKGRTFWTNEKEIKKIVMAIRPYITKFGDIPKLLEEHNYLFGNCDPVFTIYTEKIVTPNYTKGTSNLTLTTIS